MILGALIVVQVVVFFVGLVIHILAEEGLFWPVKLAMLAVVLGSPVWGVGRLAGDTSGITDVAGVLALAGIVVIVVVLAAAGDEARK